MEISVFFFFFLRKNKILKNIGASQKNKKAACRNYYYQYHSFYLLPLTWLLAGFLGVATSMASKTTKPQFHRDEKKKKIVEE